MAAKKKASPKRIVSRAKTAAKPKVAAAKKTAKKAFKQAEGLLGKLAQKSAQLILDSGLLGDAPKPAKKAKRRRDDV
jgi:vacuolar-type H+-ATPase subunit H